MKAPQRVRGTASVLLAQTLWVAMLRVRVKARLKHNDLGEAALSGAEQSRGGSSREPVEEQAPVHEQVYQEGMPVPLKTSSLTTQSLPLGGP